MGLVATSLHTGDAVHLDCGLTTVEDVYTLLRIGITDDEIIVAGVMLNDPSLALLALHSWHMLYTGLCCTHF